MRYFVTIGNRSFEVELGTGQPKIDGVEVDAALAAVAGTSVRHLLVDGHATTLLARRGGRAGRWELALGGSRLLADVVDERTRAIRALSAEPEEAAERTVVAPMPGLVLRVEVAVGDRVEAGQGVVIVEAMKMENELKAPAAGVVARVEARAGETVEKGAVLIVLE